MTAAACHAPHSSHSGADRTGLHCSCQQLQVSFRRVIDAPFASAVSALDRLLSQQTPDPTLRIERYRLSGPPQVDPATGQCVIRVEVKRWLARPAATMELQLLPGRLHHTTELELIPRRRVRASPRYFREGHRMLDALTTVVCARAAAGLIDADDGSCQR